MSAFQADSPSTDCYSGQVLAEAFYCEGGDGFIVFEGGLVMENVTVCTGVMVAVIVSGDGEV